MARAMLFLCVVNIGCVLNEKQPRADKAQMYFDERGRYLMEEHTEKGWHKER